MEKCELFSKYIEKNSYNFQLLHLKPYSLILIGLFVLMKKIEKLL